MCSGVVVCATSPTSWRKKVRLRLRIAVVPPLCTNIRRLVNQDGLLNIFRTTGQEVKRLLDRIHGASLIEGATCADEASHS
jgi:hypothetical protein